MSVAVTGIYLDGFKPVTVRVVAHQTGNFQAAFGLPKTFASDAQRRESRCRVGSAVANYLRDVEGNIQALRGVVVEYVGVPEGGLRGSLEALDLATALAVLSAMGYEVDAGRAYSAELSIGGAVRSTRGTVAIAECAATLAGAGVVVSSEAEDAFDASSFTSVFSVHNLNDVLTGRMTRVTTSGPKYRLPTFPSGRDGRTVKAIMIAAAGHHNITFCGRPGDGNVFYSRMLAAILPQPGREASRWAMKYASFAGLQRSPANVPFRALHCTVSLSAVVGTQLHAGEVHLAHTGLLLLDEASDFRADVLRAIVNVVESGEAKLGGEKVPADILLAAVFTACPCVTAYSSGHVCTCTSAAILRHHARTAKVMDQMVMAVTPNPDARDDCPSVDDMFNAVCLARAILVSEDLSGMSKLERVAQTIAALDRRRTIHQTDIDEAATFVVGE